MTPIRHSQRSPLREALPRQQRALFYVCDLCSTGARLPLTNDVQVTVDTLHAPLLAHCPCVSRMSSACSSTMDVLGLPDDVLVIIFGYFDERQRLLAVAPVCKAWNHVVASTLTHFSITNATSPMNIISSFLRSVSMQAGVHLSVFSEAFLNIESLTLTASDPKSRICTICPDLPPPRLPHLRSLSVAYPDPCRHVFALMERHCSQLTQLTFADAINEDCAFVRFRVLRSLSWRGGSDGSLTAAIASASTSLTELRIQGDLRVLFLDVLQRTPYTSLTTLQLYGDVLDEHVPHIKVHCPALRNLVLGQTNPYSNLSLTAFAPVLVELDLSHNWSNVSAYHTTGALAQCSRLTKMVFNSGYLRSEGAGQNWAALIRPCSVRLLDVEVPLKAFMPPFALKLTQRLTSLTTLRITLDGDANVDIFHHWSMPKLVNLILSTKKHCDLTSGLHLLHTLVPRIVRPISIELTWLTTERECYTPSEVLQIDHSLAMLQRCGVRKIVWRRLARAAKESYSTLVRRHPWLHLNGSD